jgi:hypothetical protein
MSTSDDQSARRQLQLQHHDGDDDGNDAIAERGQAIFAHAHVPIG